MNEVAYVGAPLYQEIGGIKTLDVLKINYVYNPDLKQIRNDLVLTSKRGVIALKMNGTSIISKRAYTIGHVTSEFLRELYGLESKYPENENSEGLADLLISDKRKYSIISSDSVSRTMLARLKENGIDFEFFKVYSIEENRQVDYSLLSNVDKILVGSSKSFDILFKNAGELLKGKALYAIGIPTFTTILSAGLKPVKYFNEPDIKKIVNEILTERI